MNDYDTTIKVHWPTYGHVCKAEFNKSKEIHHTTVGNYYRINSTGFPEPNRYPNQRLTLYVVECESNQVLFIDEFIVGLQEPISYQGYEYCVDYVKINPPINYGIKHYCGDWQKTCYCGVEDYAGGQLTLNVNKVEVTFRTSEKDNSHAGFQITFQCKDVANTDEDPLLEYLQFPSKSAVNHQQVKL